MNRYMPIEWTAPGWIEAREVVSRYLPDLLQIVPASTDRSVMLIDLSWAEQIMCLTPYEYQRPVLELFGGVNRQFQSVLPDALSLKGFLGQMVTPFTLSAMTNFLAEHDRQRKAVGLATSIEMIRHELGIEQCLLGFTPLPGSRDINQWRVYEYNK